MEAGEFGVVTVGGAVGGTVGGTVPWRGCEQPIDLSVPQLE